MSNKRKEREKRRAEESRGLFVFSKNVPITWRQVGGAALALAGYVMSNPCANPVWISSLVSIGLVMICSDVIWVTIRSIFQKKQTAAWSLTLCLLVMAAGIWVINYKIILRGYDAIYWDRDVIRAPSGYVQPFDIELLNNKCRRLYDVRVAFIVESGHLSTDKIQLDAGEAKKLMGSVRSGDNKINIYKNLWTMSGKTHDGKPCKEYIIDSIHPSSYADFDLKVDTSKATEPAVISLHVIKYFNESQPILQYNNSVFRSVGYYKGGCATVKSVGVYMMRVPLGH